LPKCVLTEMRSAGVGCAVQLQLRKPVEFNGWALEPIFYFRAALRAAGGFCKPRRFWVDRAMAGVAGALAETIGRAVEGLGYEFVDAERLAGGLLRVTIDHAGGVGLTDCERVSRQLLHLFAVEDVDYARLEVSSPGLDRPLKLARDYVRFAGAEVQVQLYAPLASTGGRRRLQGRLLELTGATGAEKVRMQLAVDDAAKDVAARAKGRKPAAAKRPVRKVGAAEGAIVEFALAEVEKAKLVPELNFRGGGKE
jgi:ribosome maturation factor RimP